MPRKKKTEVENEPPTDSPPLAIPVETETQPTESRAAEPTTVSLGEPPGLPEETQANDPAKAHAQNGHSDRRKPAISWRLQSDRTTSIELSCWANIYRTQTGEEYEQLSFTISRSYKDQTGMWVKGSSWRTHDLPVLTFLIAKAHAYALDRRTTVTAECPF